MWVATTLREFAISLVLVISCEPVNVETFVLFGCFTSQVNSYGHGGTVSSPTGVCSYVQKHVIDALEGFSQFLANEVSKVRNIVFVIVFIFGS